MKLVTCSHAMQRTKDTGAKCIMKNESNTMYYYVEDGQHTTLGSLMKYVVINLRRSVTTWQLSKVDLQLRPCTEDERKELLLRLCV